MQFFVGVDGGGTKTEAVTCDPSGRVLCTLTGPSTNPRAIGFPQAVSNLDRLLKELLDRPEFNSLSCAGICLGLAGVDLPEEKEQFISSMEQLRTQRGDHFRITVTNDAEIALMATLEQNYGLIAISGTGSIVYGITRGGNRYRVGGWGHLLGDEGSGYSIGLNTLRAVMYSFDGLDPDTLLTDYLLEAYGWKTITELKSYIYQDHIRKSEIASFARYCIQASQQGDSAAEAIINREAAALARQSAALICKNDEFSEGHLVASGSIFKHSELFLARFQQQLHEVWPGVTVHSSRQTPAYGAAQLAVSRSLT